MRERIHDDGVGMRWIRTAATTISSLTAALVIIWGALIWTIGPRFEQWAQELVDGATEDMAADLASNRNHLDRLDAVVVRLEETVAALSQTIATDISDSWRFSPPDTSISDGEIGGEIVVTAAGWKLRDCGVPVVDLYFVNGNGIYHRFENASVLTADGRGIAFPVDPSRLQHITYTARIPADDNVKPGRAQGWISVTYPDKCPAVPPSVAGPMQFRIAE